MAANTSRQYKSTESKYKGGAQEMYVTYEVKQETRGGKETLYPKVKRVYVAGKVKNWKVGNYSKRTGKRVHGVKIEYEQSRSGYARKPFAAKRGSTQYKVSSSKVASGASQFSKIVEVPKDARNVKFHSGKLPSKYQTTLQRVR